MKYKRLNSNNTVVEIFNTQNDTPITEYLHPDVAAMFTPCDDTVEVNWQCDPVSGICTAPIDTPRLEETLPAVLELTPEPPAQPKPRASTPEPEPTPPTT